mgnify:FL=1
MKASWEIIEREKETDHSSETFYILKVSISGLENESEAKSLQKSIRELILKEEGQTTL